MKPAFRGGVHPEECKRTRGRGISALSLPPRLFVSLSQHIGAPSQPEVKAGDRVARGQRIARAGGYVSVPVHAPAAGKVAAVEPAPHPSGRMVPAVVIEPDGSGEEVRNPADPGFARGPAAWKEMVKEAGIVGMGGAAFPTHVKLSPPADKPIHTFIANGVECEPFLTADHRLMLEDGARILAGLALAMEMTGAKRGIVAVEANKPDAAERMRSLSLPPGVAVAVLPVQYPQGAEKQLIRALLGREVPTRGLPMDVGVVVHNVATLAAIHRAVTEGIPLMERVLTLGGTLPAGEGNYRAALGTPLRHLLDETGGTKGEPARILLGGPMMGQAVVDLAVPVMKGTSGVLFFGPGDLPAPLSRPCVRCGACIRTCPMDLLPHSLANHVEWELFDRLPEYHIADCIECGCCSYVCPAGRELVQWIRQGKGEVLSLSAKRAAK